MGLRPVRGAPHRHRASLMAPPCVWADWGLSPPSAGGPGSGRAGSPASEEETCSEVLSHCISASEEGSPAEEPPGERRCPRGVRAAALSPTSGTSVTRCHSSRERGGGGTSPGGRGGGQAEGAHGQPPGQEVTRRLSPRCTPGTLLVPVCPASQRLGHALSRATSPHDLPWSLPAPRRGWRHCRACAWPSPPEPSPSSCWSAASRSLTRWRSASRKVLAQAGTEVGGGGSMARV